MSRVQEAGFSTWPASKDATGKPYQCRDCKKPTATYGRCYGCSVLAKQAVDVRRRAERAGGRAAA